jgi:hypothetical protein
MSKLNFDASKVTPQAPREVIPNGWYKAKVTKSELKPTKGVGGELLQLSFEIIEGEHAGAIIIDSINVKNKSVQAQQIGQEQLSALCHAVNVIVLKDSESLHGIPFQLHVKTEPARTDKDTGTEYEARNKVGGFKPLEGGAPIAQVPAFVAKKGPTPPPAKAKPTPPAPAKVERKPDERKFYVHIEGESVEKTGDEVAIMLRDGMPADTPVVLDGESDWQTADHYKIEAMPAEGDTAAAPKAPGGRKKAPWET